MKLFRHPVLVVAIYALVLLGCGQKGPLYLPEKQPTPVITKQDNATTNKVQEQSEAVQNNSSNPQTSNEITPE